MYVERLIKRESGDNLSFGEAIAEVSCELIKEQ